METKKRIYTQNKITQSKLSYNEIGQLKQKNLHVNGSTVAQEIVYGYNERGWLSKMNNPAAVTAKQVFGMELSYADKADTYNGNIGTMKWNTKVTAAMTLQPVQTYSYSYDKLNRLSRGSYINAGAAGVNKEGFYDEELRYDNMGNIDTLRRTSGSKTWSNNFKYTYSGHKLTKVTDAATPARTNSFAYDVNGNATTNTRLGITKIEYNYLNLPVRFIKGVDTLMYKYDGLGQKLTKKLGGAKTDYVNGIQYKDGALEFIQTEEGRILPNNGSYIYEYFLKDHLGNTRAVVDHSGTIKQIQDYYPFGMEMNQGNSLNAASNLYKYNGKEKQVEMGLDQFDYGTRFYDAEIGRWNVVDPLAEMFDNVSPYNYGMNNPILMVDPTGMAADTAQVWGYVPAISGGGLSIPWNPSIPTGIGTFPRTKLAPFPPPNPFLLLFGLLLLPSNYFDPPRSKDEIEQKPIVFSEKKTIEDLKKKYPSLGKSGGKVKGEEGTEMHDAHGGYTQAKEDFDSVNVGKARDIPGGKIGSDSKGRTLMVREKSNTKDANGKDRPTLEVQIKVGGRTMPETKIRY